MATVQDITDTNLRNMIPDRSEEAGNVVKFEGRGIDRDIANHRYLYAEIGRLCQFVDPTDELYEPSKAPNFDALIAAEPKLLRKIVRRPVTSSADIQAKVRYLLEAEGNLHACLESDDIEQLLRSLVLPNG